MSKLTQINEQATQIKSMAQGMLENGMPLEDGG